MFEIDNSFCHHRDTQTGTGFCRSRRQNNRIFLPFLAAHLDLFLLVQVISTVH